jgi:hypothetical protein
VLTVLVLLRREANSPSFTVYFEIRMRDGWQTDQYNYTVVQLWDEAPEPLREGVLDMQESNASFEQKRRFGRFNPPRPTCRHGFFSDSKS